MKCQRDKFSIDEGIVYLNGAYMSPIPKRTEHAGIEGLIRKRTPSNLSTEDFFEPVDECRRLFSKIVGITDPERVVVIPSVAYGMANVCQNLEPKKDGNIIILEEQFPSNYYPWKRYCEENNQQLVIAKRPHNPNEWTDHILQHINDRTTVITMSHVHWGDGTVFDLEKISLKARTAGARLILDGTQSIGAIPYDQDEIQADALIVSAYKWLLGPYGVGLAYYGPCFDDGEPITQSWLNRPQSSDFQHLTNYQSSYRLKARRYEVGEAPDFIKMPMLTASLAQLLEWQPINFQAYCRSIVTPILPSLKEAGFRLLDEENMAFHLFGVRLPDGLSMSEVKDHLKNQKIIVSYRQDAIRISPSVYNTAEELDQLRNALLDLVS